MEEHFTLVQYFLLMGNCVGNIVSRSNAFHEWKLSISTDIGYHKKGSNYSVLPLVQFWDDFTFRQSTENHGCPLVSAGTGFWRPLQTVWIQMRRHRTWRLIRIQTVCYSDSILWKKIEENANFRNLADNILADDKFPSMQSIAVMLWTLTS